MQHTLGRHPIRTDGPVQTPNFNMAPDLEGTYRDHFERATAFHSPSGEFNVLELALEGARGDVEALEADAPYLRGLTSEAREAVGVARAALKAGGGDADTLTFAQSKLAALEALLSEHEGEIYSAAQRVSALEQRREALREFESLAQRKAFLLTRSSALQAQRDALLERLEQFMSDLERNFATLAVGQGLITSELAFLFELSNAPRGSQYASWSLFFTDTTALEQALKSTVGARERVKALAQSLESEGRVWVESELGSDIPKKGSSKKAR